MRWSLSVRGWQRHRRVSTVCGGGPSPTRGPETRSTADPMWTGTEECHRQSGSVSRAGGWEPWRHGGQSDASEGVNRILSELEAVRSSLFIAYCSNNRCAMFQVNAATNQKSMTFCILATISTNKQKWIKTEIAFWRRWFSFVLISHSYVTL